MPALFGTQAVPANAVSVIVLGAFPSTYQLALNPGWNTGVWVVPADKLTTQFTVYFSTPAPAGGSFIDWQLSATSLSPTPAGATTLTAFLQELNELLHDPDNNYWTVAQKTFYLNKALQRRDLDTGQNRTLITFVTTIGTDTYTFTQIGNTNVYDLVSINLLFQNLRLVLGCFSFSELNARLRTYNPPLQWAPVGYARYGPNQFVIAPAPAIAYSLELDCSQITPANWLVNPGDADLLPAPYNQPVAYYAASLAKLNERRYDEAQEFVDLYRQKISELDSNKVGMVPSLY